MYILYGGAGDIILGPLAVSSFLFLLNLFPSQLSDITTHPVSQVMEMKLLRAERTIEIIGSWLNFRKII